ncbi:class I SAM-dependent methyltransferase [Streptomyces sp. NBC_01218]|uniref:class I SAM-dependent methyltransferase n=1 Tax=Streptomyces sp. NBC_01218 TaxID=2903780 RepID=UPI002E159CEA|nr:class I SAM-dependent methyltransferase [Streptomyces sp. NBC_01218]
MFSDADAAALYDVLSPWDPGACPADAFYTALVDDADSVLDVGCGTGAMLTRAREHGHTGRLVGVDPDPAALARARRRTDVEWFEGTAADVDRPEVRGGGEGRRPGFTLATMVSHAFQCLVTDEEVRASLIAVRAALRPGGLFAFETRHPQARAWEEWGPDRATTVEDPSGRRLRVAHEVAPVTEGGVVTFTTTTSSAGPDAAVLRTDRSRLRFLEGASLDRLLAGAGFQIEGRYGDWDRTPVTGASREIITLARRPA